MEPTTEITTEEITTEETSENLETETLEVQAKVEVIEEFPTPDPIPSPQEKKRVSRTTVKKRSRNTPKFVR